MKQNVFTAIFGSAIMLSMMIINQNGPSFLSKQTPINPNHLTASYTPSAQTAIFNNQPIKIPENVSRTQLESQVLGIADSQDDEYNFEEKKIFVDLSNQRLYAFEGDELKYNFLISSGKWGRTPTGTFRIWIKLKSTLMAGGNKALGTYYYLPNVPYTMYFYNNMVSKDIGYGIHGAYWHDNFGHPMSHGCINMKTEEVEQLYYWASPEGDNENTIYSSIDNPGTEIMIFGEAPAS